MKDKKIWIIIVVIIIAILAIWGITSANKSETKVEDQIQEESPNAEKEDSGIETETPDSQQAADQDAATIDEVEGTAQE